MKHAPDKHHRPFDCGQGRRSIRMRGYDYTQPGAYFVTICTQNRVCLFGDIVDNEMVLNDAGRLVQSVWDAIPDHYAGVDADAFVIMPNHIHSIFVLTPVGACATPVPVTFRRAGPADNGQPRGVAPTESAVMGQTSVRLCL